MLPVSGTSDARLQLGSLTPVLLVSLTSASGTLRFSTDRAIEYQGQVYQPYIQAPGTLLTSANFPENHTASKEYQLQFENAPIRWQGIEYPYLSHLFDSFPWELASANVSVLFLPEAGTVSGTTALPLVTSGIAGAPGDVTRSAFFLAIAPRNIGLNDQIPMRAVRSEEFPEVDRDELNGRTYLPIVVGSGVRVRARATAAGATTTVTEPVTAGTTLKVSETTGFADGDSIILGGYVNNPFTIGTVDASLKRFTGLTPNLGTLGITIAFGTVVREDKADYDFSVANHQCGSISEVRVTADSGETTVISGSLYSKLTVLDPKGIGGYRTDVRISQLIPFGSPNPNAVTQQPVATVNNGNHKHDVAVSQANTVTSFANATSGPDDAGNANDGNADTAANVNTTTVGEDILTLSSFTALDGTFVSQRYYAVMSGPVVTGNVRIRRSGSTFLTLSAGFAKGEFRGTLDTGGSSTSSFTIEVQTDPTQALVFEAWKDVTTSPSVAETTKDLTQTTRTQDVAIDVSGANLEVGEIVEVVIDGAVDDGSITGVSGTVVARPDQVMRWLLQRALGQTTAILDLASYQTAGASFASTASQVAFAIEQPIKLDELFDQIANNAGGIHWWGRDGHNVRALESFAAIPAPVASFTEDQAGVSSLSWRNAYTANEIRNDLTAYFGRDWTRTAGQDESYAGTVASRDLTSQARYGVRGAEVTEDGKAIYLDLVPTAALAQPILDLIAGHKAFPRKDFDLETEWSAGYRLEPGDVVAIDSPTLSAPVSARVLSQELDQNFQCRITAREVGGVAQPVGAADTGFRSPSIGASVAPGDTAWTNPSNAFSSNNAYAIASMSSAHTFTEYLQLTGFGFSIPSDATIDGVILRIEYKETGAGNVADHEQFLVINNVIGGDSRVDIFTGWPSSDTLKDYGASDDAWGNTLTPAIVNASGFGVAIKARNNDAGSLSAAPNIDHVQLRVYYHVV